jgi:CheY-specific phosphatase CheX
LTGQKLTNNEKNIVNTIEPIRKRVEDYITSDTEANIFDMSFSEDISSIRLYDYTTAIAINGTINGSCVMSFDRRFLYNVIELMLGDKPTDDLVESLISDTASEILNIILGNSISDIEKHSSNLSISPPMIQEDTDFIKSNHYTNYVANYSFNTDKGCITFSYLDKELLCY